MINSLFGKLTSSDVEDLIQEQNLIKDGFTLSYIVDPHDINNYCYPFGLTMSNKDKSYDEKDLKIVTDEQIAYYSLFNSDCYFSILDEYRDEFENFKKAINYRKHLSLEIVDNFKTLVQKYNELKNSKSINFELLKDYENIAKNISEYHITLFLSLSLGSLRDGMEKLISLENNKNLIITEDDVIDNLPFPKAIKDILLLSRPAENTDILYSSIRSTIDSNKISLSSKLALYRDCQAIDRVTQFNRQIAIENEKILFLFLSSTDKSKRVYKHLAKNLYVNVAKQTINPHRTISQLFLKLICKENNTNATISNLEEIKEILIDKENCPDCEMGINNETIGKFENRISTFRKKFENSSLLIQFDSRKLESVLTDSLKNPKNILKRELISYIQDILKLADYKQEFIEIKKTSLKEISYERSFIRTLKNGIQQIADENNETLFEISSGEDYVSNLHHHFPIIFNTENTEVNLIVSRIIDFYLEPKLNRDTTKKLVELINSSLKLIFGKTSNGEQKIIRILIFLMLPKFDNNTYEKNAYSRVQEIVENEIENSELKAEFIYVASWIARRIKLYPESLSWAEKGLNARKNDPRFFHSKTLANYCLYMDSHETIYLDDSINNCLKSIEFYKQINSEKKEVKKSIIAVVNTLSYLYCLKYELNNKREFIGKSRIEFNKLKSLEEGYKSFPEFLHTEALLEYLEYGLDNNVNRLFLAKESIIKAIKFLEKNSYKELLYKIEQRLANKGS